MADKKISTELKKINAEVEKKKVRDEEILSDDELDAVAGGGIVLCPKSNPSDSTH